MSKIEKKTELSVGGEGFEPSKVVMPTDLQSAPFVHLDILPMECPRNLYGHS